MQTIELNGRPIAVMGASHDHVEEFAESDAFRADLLDFVDGDGRPVWDGKGAFLPAVRPSSPEETAAFRQSFTAAIEAGEADAGDPGDWLMFLIEARDTAANAVEVDEP